MLDKRNLGKIDLVRLEGKLLRLQDKSGAGVPFYDTLWGAVHRDGSRVLLGMVYRHGMPEPDGTYQFTFTTGDLFIVEPTRTRPWDDGDELVIWDLTVESLPPAAVKVLDQFRALARSATPIYGKASIYASAFTLIRGMALGAGLSQLDAFMTAHFAKSRRYFTE